MVNGGCDGKAMLNDGSNDKSNDKRWWWLVAAVVVVVVPGLGSLFVLVSWVEAVSPGAMAIGRCYCPGLGCGGHATTMHGMRSSSSTHPVAIRPTAQGAKGVLLQLLLQALQVDDER